MESVKTIKAEREVLEQQLKEPVADISTQEDLMISGFTFSSSLVPKFLQALKDLGDVDEEVISEAHLRTEYGKLQEQVN